jgi:hypothetical protein
LVPAKKLMPMILTGCVLGHRWSFLTIAICFDPSRNKFFPSQQGGALRMKDISPVQLDGTACMFVKMVLQAYTPIVLIPDLSIRALNCAAV